ncbi:hypothetical protein BO70DRAFT_283449 [Aspergillus heteromorphus CBS 117.55]|uniref:Uncharacterized protein n=1 Tax=Aspergillus heteromorphus CBS 117.55 TaxID=1448321 RepID=A0A317WX09_9EURO|nr:uncharacterized protein BO70DRAFT_283449 [Aspergillus heteromorphus CBS 117.55]PWY90883.1 hypothetical protein BO70DRAFT_283449 [Aspergillus heteromorphus CBS 117.55]
MSNYPPTPSFVGPNYNPQWPPSNPSQSTAVPSLMPPHFPFNQNPSPIPHPPQDGANRSFDYTFEAYNANSQLPGLGGPGAAGPIPPPPFPFMAPFAAAQFPPPFPLQMPPLRYPSIPIPSSAPVFEPSPHPMTDFQPQRDHSDPTRARPQLPVAPASDPDPDREEGELTDLDVPLPTRSKQSDPRSARQSVHALHPPKRLPQNRDGGSSGVGSTMKISSDAGHGSNGSAVSEGSGRDGSDVEKGEASSEAHLSSRSSGSPYNPALPILGAPPMPIETTTSEAPASLRPQHETVSEKEANNAMSSDSQSLVNGGRSPAQLRVQAQGALLSLAPHNIRYGELVGEGINPDVLRQLYEEVGIKIATPRPDAALDSVPEDTLSASERPAIDHPSDLEHGRESTDVLGTEITLAQHPSPVTAAAVATPSPPSGTKPMERKEVIARMLAAKAAKRSGEPVPPQPESTKETHLPVNLEQPDADKAATASSTQQLAKEKDVRVKEKNKAQTELARQRIEQLKKQGLMRNGLKPQAESMPSDQSQASSNSGQDMLPAPTPAPIQHPLPERPPDPESNAHARIPGLFMTDQEPSAVYTATPATEASADATPQPRINQRKRPRASDFDEPVPIPKKTFNNTVNHVVPEAQRLVIDISDDEFYGDDENDSMDIDTPAGKDLQDAESFLGAFPPADLLTRPKTASSQGFSTTSVTPQGSRNNDQEHQEHLRKKDLEIKAMHRRIAELEERKKAKLAASRAQSPRATDSRGPSLLTNPVTADDVSDVSRASLDAELGGMSTPALDIRLSTSADITHIERMKLKLLRRQEIEAGLPALEAEIQRSEAKLAEVNDEEDKLSLEITKGKEGRRQLLDELRTLNLELNGLTFEDVDTALLRLQTREQLNTQEVDRQITDENEMLPETFKSRTPLEESGVVQESSLPQAPQAPQSSSARGLSTISVDKMMDHISDSPHDPSTDSDSTGSAMDESSDSSSDDSDDQHGMQARTPVPETGEVWSPKAPTEDEQPHVDELGAANIHHPIPEDSQSASCEPQVGMIFDEQATRSLERSSRESSVSDAYEPPEPEVTASPADSTYSPPFSPASPGPIEPTEVSSLSVDETKQAEQPLTGVVQELEIEQPIASTQVGVLDVRCTANRPRAGC